MSQQYEIVNGLIKNIRVANVRRREIAFWTNLQIGAAGATNRSIPLAKAKELFEVFNVEELNDLVDEPIRCKMEGMALRAIGHFLEDRWLTVDGLTVD